MIFFSCAWPVGSEGLGGIVQTSGWVQGPKGFPCYACDVRLTLLLLLLLLLLPFVQVPGSRFRLRLNSRSFVCPDPARLPGSPASLRPLVVPSPSIEPSLSALEWFRLHFTCECCCFLNYGDRNRVEAAAESQPQPCHSRSRSLRAKPLFRLRFCDSCTAQWYQTEESLGS